MIGDVSPSEMREFQDPDTGYRVKQLTNGHGHSYPLYYFVPSVTNDGRYLIFHSERTSWVQLYRLDLLSGEISQLTDGRTANSGWAIWCEWRLRGIYNHLSALNPVRSEVYYFQDDQLRVTNVLTFENRIVRELAAGRIPVGQSAFSPDGSLFAYIHVDRATFFRHMKDREVRTNMGLYQGGDHQAFRRSVGATLSVVDVDTGAQRDIIEPGFYFHHALFVDDQTILVNHPRDCAGMWTVGLDGVEMRHLRPADAPGAHGAEVNHQVVTDTAIVYEAVRHTERATTTYFGRYDWRTHQFDEIALPVRGYVHTGFDPAGRFEFIEHADQEHELLSIHRRSGSPREVELRLLRKLQRPRSQQRSHAHPFLTPDRHHLVFTDRAENRFNQVYSMDVRDLVAGADR